MKNISYAHVFKELLFTDLRAFKNVIKDKLIDLFIWISTVTAVTSYLMPLFGLEVEFGPFTLVGLAASAGLFELFPAVMNMISDFENDQVIAYYMTLPIASWLVFMRAIVYYAISSAALGTLVLPVGNLFLRNPIALTEIHIIKFITIFLLMNMFYGAFTLFIASYVKNMLRVGSVWMRIVYPLWFLGGFQFSWYALHSVSKSLAYLDLINPITYIMEGLRAAVLGQEGYMSFWICILMLALCTIFCSYVGIVRLKRRLDFI